MSEKCRLSRLGRTLALAFAPALLTLGCLKQPDRYAQSTLDASINPPATFELEGEPFCFAGTNNYYPIFKPRDVVDDLFKATQALDFKVMRIWSALNTGSLDGTVPHAHKDKDKEGVYLQYWDTKTNAPALNEGENGLQRLDYVLDVAARYNIKLILVLVNNWLDFGGMDQYVVWFKKQHHHEFYTDPQIKQAYKNWVRALVTRTNSINGKLYRDDPAIFAWELANEPRAIGSGGYDTKEGWDKSTITKWAGEMSTFIKSIDPNHLVAVGDEGFLDAGGPHWTYQANDGVDHRALTALPNIDFGTFHLYPDHWGGTIEWGDQWIVDHLRVARELHKPTILEEYGLQVTRSEGNLGDIIKGWPERKRAYTSWNDTMIRRGGNGSLIWILAGKDNDAPRYPDWDHFGFWRDSPTGQLMGEIAKRYPKAAACENAGPSGPTRSPFVRVRGGAAEEVALMNPNPWTL